MVSNDNTLLYHLEASYRLLSACLYQPSGEWVETNLFGQLKQAIQVIAPSVADRVDAMEAEFKRAGETELMVVYSRLFVGPFSLEAPPYGSYYLEAEKRIMGETTVAVRDFYLRMGLDLDQDFTELPDHMAVELEFVSYLLQRTLASIESDTGAAAQWTEQRRDFLRSFLERWYAEFCGAIRTATDNPFYRAHADCLEAVIGRDSELLGLA